MSTERIELQFKATADTSGAKEMASAVGATSVAADKVAPALDKAGKASKEMGQGLGRAVEVGGATTALMQNLGNASKGGAEGMFAAGRAVLSFGQIVKGVLVGAGPVGIAVAALGLLAGAAMALWNAFKPAKETVEQFKEKLDTLDKANLRSLDATLSALSDRLKRNKEEADDLRAALDKIDDAEMAAKLAENKGNTKLNERQKEKQEQLIRDEFKQRRQQRERQALVDDVSAATEKRDALAPEFEDARRAYGDKLTELDRINATSREVKRMMDDVVRLQNEATGPSDPKWVERRNLLGRARELDSTLPTKDEAAKFDAELASARNRFQGDDGKGGIAAQYNAAVEELRKANAKLARTDSTNTEVGKWDTRKTVAEDAAREASTEAAKAAREEEKQKQLARMRLTPEATWRTRAASGMMSDEDRALFPDAFSKAKALPESRLQPVTDGLNKAAAAAEKAPDPKPAADAADRLAAATETSTQAQAQALAQVVSALAQATSVAAQSAELSIAQAGKIAALQSRLATLSSQIAAARQRSSG